MTVVKSGVPTDQLIDPSNVNSKQEWTGSSKYEDTVQQGKDNLIIELRAKIRKLEAIIVELEKGKTIID